MSILRATFLLDLFQSDSLQSKACQQTLEQHVQVVHCDLSNSGPGASDSLHAACHVPGAVHEGGEVEDKILSAGVPAYHLNDGGSVGSAHEEAGGARVKWGVNMVIFSQLLCGVRICRSCSSFLLANTMCASFHNGFQPVLCHPMAGP